MIVLEPPATEPGGAGGCCGRSRLLLTLSAEARAYLRVLEDHGALQKPRRNRPLAAEDLTGLEQMVIDAGVGTATRIATGLGPR